MRRVHAPTESLRHTWSRRGPFLTSPDSGRMIQTERAYLAAARVVVTLYFRSPLFRESPPPLPPPPRGAIGLIPHPSRRNGAVERDERRKPRRSRPREVSDFPHSLPPSRVPSSEPSRAFEESAGGPIDSFSPPSLGSPVPLSADSLPPRRLAPPRRSPRKPAGRKKPATPLSRHCLSEQTAWSCLGAK